MQWVLNERMRGFTGINLPLSILLLSPGPHCIQGRRGFKQLPLSAMGVLRTKSQISFESKQDILIKKEIIGSSKGMGGQKERAGRRVEQIKIMHGVTNSFPQ